MQENRMHVLVILRDISERTSYEQEMKRLNNELRELATHQITAREEERSFIAKEIHDALAQNLVALNLNASYLKSKLEKDENKLILDEQIAISNELISSSRVLFNSLHPSMLDEIGLVAAIKWYVKARLKSGNVLFNIYSTIEDESLPINVRLDLFRIFQESFTNTLRYANAKKITVDIKSEGQHIVMLISDDGCGFDMNEVNTKIQHGLLGMRERVYTLSGSFTIQSKPGEGTRIEVAVPFGVK
jgi:signal transduction histidine kinase